MLDENSAPRLLQGILDFFPGSEHVTNVGLGSGDDRAVWDYAKAHHFAIVSKDSDFADRSVLEREPPKVIWIRLEKCSTTEVQLLLRAHGDAIRTFIEEDDETCLLLGRALLIFMNG